MLAITSESEYWSVHTHSKFSNKDALPEVSQIVRRAKALGYKGLGLTDHGNMAGSVQLYIECAKAGIRPFPGSELYLVVDRQDKKAKRYHLGVIAFTTQGYRNLIHLSSLTHKNFHHKPLVDLSDLARLSEEGRLKGIAALTGCHFSYVVQTLLQQGPDAAEGVITTLASWFDLCFIEVQNHSIERTEEDEKTDAEVSQELYEIHQRTGIPMVLAQDSHYTHPRDRKTHETLKRLVSFSDDPDDAIFPGDGYHMVDHRWMQKRFPKEIYDAGIEGLSRLLDAHDLVIEELDTYADRMPVLSADPQAELTARVTEELKRRGMGIRYKRRLQSELEVIEVTRTAGYMLLVAQVTDFCAEQGIIYQARGSAAGSLVSYLLGISQVDPIKWGLLMERFMSKDRTRPPDIDLDVEHTRRKEVLEMLDERFSILQIGTWGKYLLGEDEDGQDKGSLLRLWMQMRGKRGQSNSWNEIDPQEREMINQLSAKETLSNYGVHAAGQLVTGTKEEMNHLVPTMYVASSRTTVSQYHMKDVEELGVVKLDVLGLKTLSVVARTVQYLGRKMTDGLDWIPLNDSRTYTAISKGKTDAVFQLEGYTARKGVKQMRPRKIQDVIAAMGLFRPAIMESGATRDYLDYRSGEKRQPNRHEIIAEVTKDTHGVLLYQEQVITLLRELGLTPEELTRFLGAIKASNANISNAGGVIAEMMQDILTRCRERGMQGTDIDWLTSALEAYSGYGFNRAHSTVYGVTAYRTAYLATNHPVEFFAAALGVFAGDDKEQDYLKACRVREIRVLSPDVNVSTETYEFDPKRKAIRKGFSGIKHVGVKAAEAIVASAPYTSIEDFVRRVDHRAVTGTKAWAKKETITRSDFKDSPPIGVLGKLLDAGALDSLFEEE